MTIAPELPGSLEAINYLVKRGIKVSIGHSEGTLEDAQRAINMGASCLTHMFNAMRGVYFFFTFFFLMSF